MAVQGAVGRVLQHRCRESLGACWQQRTTGGWVQTGLLQAAVRTGQGRPEQPRRVALLAQLRKRDERPCQASRHSSTSLPVLRPPPTGPPCCCCCCCCGAVAAAGAKGSFTGPRGRVGRSGASITDGCGLGAALGTGSAPTCCFGSGWVRPELLQRSRRIGAQAARC